MKLYFVRHGESVANLLHEISNRGFKHGLTKRGFQQAEQLALELGRLQFAKIYTSPLKRAFQTAEILKQHQDCPLEISDALREYDCGVLEGKSDPESWAIFERVSSQWVQGEWDARIPGGESHIDIQSRFIPFIEHLAQTFEDENILLVGHGGLFRSMFPLVFENMDSDSIRDFTFEHTTPIIAETRPDGLHCTQWGEIML